MEFAVTGTIGTGSARQPLEALLRLMRRAGGRWVALRTRRALSDLDRLDDRLLRDVGLRRERLPSGTTRIALL